MEESGTKWFAGVDWGTRTHQACVLDGDGKVVGERAFAHGGEGLSGLSDWLASFASGAAGSVGVAIETPRGPVVESLMERGFAVHSINPKQLDRFRDRDDRRDAWVLASALRTDPHCLRRLSATPAERVELREWSRLAEYLTRERTRQANRMREQLWRYYPQFLDAVDGEVASAFALALWKRLPNPGAGRKARESTRALLLKRHGIRRIDAETLRLRAPSAPLALRFGGRRRGACPPRGEAPGTGQRAAVGGARASRRTAGPTRGDAGRQGAAGCRGTVGRRGAVG